MVGAIADLRLQQNKKVAARVSALLDGLSLEKAAPIPDSIKGWDDCGGDPGQYSVSGSARVNAELRAFVKANACATKYDHHQYHYTDVPIAGNEKYGDGRIGRSDQDIVHMIAFCIRVLANREPQPNKRAITKTVAIILLTHYLGDIHQPLHVGAEYFDRNGEPIEPTSKVKWFGDQGGNKLNLFLLIDGKVRALGKFHGYWDGKAVAAAFGDAQDSVIAEKLANTEPKNWKLTGSPESIAEQMANEILPIAREAHRRLAYSKVRIDDSVPDIVAGRAAEIPENDKETYAEWSQMLVTNEIAKAGWRLSAILTEVLK